MNKKKEVCSLNKDKNVQLERFASNYGFSLISCFVSHNYWMNAVDDQRKLFKQKVTIVEEQIEMEEGEETVRF